MANDALILFIIMLGCVLIAAAICWVVWGRARNAMEFELATVRIATERELAELLGRCEELEQSQDLNADALAQCQDERGKLEARCAELSRELKDVTGQLADANGKMVDLKLALRNAGDGGAGDPELSRKLNETQSELAELIIDRDDWRGRYEALEVDYKSHAHGANAEQVSHLREQLAEALERCKALKIELAVRESQGEAESTEGSTEKPESPESVAAAEPPELTEPTEPPEPPPPPVVDPRAETLARIAGRAEQIDLDRLGKAEDGQKDDLTQIKGIGPFVERKLNALGICTFAQIAQFTASDEDQVNDAIEFFPGRVRRDDWAGQARRICEQNDGDPG